MCRTCPTRVRPAQGLSRGDGQPTRRTTGRPWTSGGTSAGGSPTSRGTIPTTCGGSASSGRESDSARRSNGVYRARRTYGAQLPGFDRTFAFSWHDGGAGQCARVSPRRHRRRRSPVRLRPARQLHGHGLCRRRGRGGRGPQEPGRCRLSGSASGGAARRRPCPRACEQSRTKLSVVPSPTTEEIVPEHRSPSPHPVHPRAHGSSVPEGHRVKSASIRSGASTLPFCECDFVRDAIRVTRPLAGPSRSTRAPRHAVWYPEVQIHLPRPDQTRRDRRATASDRRVDPTAQFAYRPISPTSIPPVWATAETLQPGVTIHRCGMADPLPARA